MQEDKRENPNSEVSRGVESHARQPMEISPEALEQLRNAAIPIEFLKVAREFIPRTEMLSPTVPQRSPTSAEIEESYIERPMPERLVEPKLEMPTEPWPEETSEPQLEMPVEPMWKEVSWTDLGVPPRTPEEVPRGEGAETFYLTDLKLDLSRVRHSTPGLAIFSETTIEWVVRNTFFMLEDPEPPPCPRCNLVVLIDDKLWNRASFAITNDRLKNAGKVIRAGETRLLETFYKRKNPGGSTKSLRFQTKQVFEDVLRRDPPDGVGIKDKEQIGKILGYFATGDAVAGARDWTLEQSRQSGGCFYIWEFNDTTGFKGLRSYEIQNGEAKKRKEYKENPSSGPRFSDMLPELQSRKGRIDELLVFHHGDDVREAEILEFLNKILVVQLKIPVCRLVYWACNAAVSIDIVKARGPRLDPEPEEVSAGIAAIKLMEGFLALAYKRTATDSSTDECPCDGAVEFVYPTEGKCGVNLPFDDPGAFTGDGQVRRISFGYRQGDGSIGRDPPNPSKSIIVTDPADRPFAEEKGEILTVWVTADPKLKQ